jgi:hypothetical protein
MYLTVVIIHTSVMFHMRSEMTQIVVLFQVLQLMINTVGYVGNPAPWFSNLANKLCNLSHIHVYQFLLPTCMLLIVSLKSPNIMVIDLGQWISSLFTRIPPTKQDWISSLYLWEIEVFQQPLKLESYKLQCNHCISHMIHMIEIDSHDEPHNSARYAFIHCTVLGFQVFVAFSWAHSWLATLLYDGNMQAMKVLRKW